MSVYRMVLLATLVPCLFIWIRGKCGFRAADAGLLLFCAWATASIVAAHGIQAAVQPSGILFVETFGSYLLARCYIRTPQDFRAMVTLMGTLVALLVPFAFYEWVTGSKPLLNAFGHIFPTVDVTQLEPRWGFWRVQGPFAHAIAYGVFCGSTFALTHLVLRDGRSPAFRRLLSAWVFVAAFVSMSSAPIAGLVLQGVLMTWNSVLRGYQSRWWILLVLIFAAYVVVEIGSNQSAAQFYVSHFTFDQQTGWIRMWTWEYASNSVLNFPLLGIGFAEWVRPRWLPDSIDNFWLATAVRHGLPALVLILASCLWTMLAVANKKILREEWQSYRLAYILSFSTFMIVGTTVHFWSAPYVWFLFMLGSGSWLLDDGTGDKLTATHSDRATRPLGHRSFARGASGRRQTCARRESLLTRA